MVAAFGHAPRRLAGSGIEARRKKAGFLLEAGFRKSGCGGRI
jgi:hypothetical protein